MTVDLVRARFITRGEEELLRLPPRIANAGFQRFLVRTLGTGACLTEFLIAGVPLPRASAAGVATLGGLVNAIIAAFDDLLDTGTLSSLTTGAPKPAGTACPRRQFVDELIGLYFQKLNQMPCGNPHVLALTRIAIRRMYQAELLTQNGNLGVGRSVWWRKNTLPFVVMGLPAWFSPTGSPSGFGRHLRWLARVGEFLGWIDDWADYADDLASGQVNRIVTLLHEQPSGQSMESIADRIALLGARVMAAWDHPTASRARSAFEVTVWTWIRKPKPGATPMRACADRPGGSLSLSR